MTTYYEAFPATTLCPTTDEEIAVLVHFYFYDYYYNSDGSYEAPEVEIVQVTSGGINLKYKLTAAQWKSLESDLLAEILSSLH